MAVFDESYSFPNKRSFHKQTSSQVTQSLVETVVGSQVISIQVAGVEDGTPLDAPIQLVLSLNQIENQNGTNVENPVCVFWDFALASK